MLIRVIDFETGGLDAEDGVCEVGWCDVTDAGVGPPTSILTNPGRMMPDDVIAVHGITNEMVQDAPPYADGFMRLMEGGVTTFCAHNCEFEQRFFGGAEVPWICTYKVALRLFPDAQSHKNSELARMMGLRLDPALSGPLHRAAPDAYITAVMLHEIIVTHGLAVADMIQWSSEPKKLSRIPFGKHKGRKWEDIPSSYLAWLAENISGEDIRMAAQAELRLRETVEG